MNNYLLKNENAIYYESGFSCDNVFFLSLGREKFFITDPRYSSEAKECVKEGIEVVETKDLYKSLRNIIRKNNIKKLFFNPLDISYGDYLEISKITTLFLNPKKEFSKIKRIIKSDNEIKLLKKASLLGKEGFLNLATRLDKGMSEFEINYLAKEALSHKGLYDLSFDPITAIEANAAKPHALPMKTKLYKNNLLLIDAGLKYKRYCSDRTVTLNYKSNLDIANRKQKFKDPFKQKIYDIVLKAQEKAISKARAGMKANEIDKLARSVIEDAGYGKYFIHSTGHGVGLDIHEYPIISQKSDIVIEENMVFTIEPGIYLDDKFGVRIEDSVAIQNGKAVIL